MTVGYAIPYGSSRQSFRCWPYNANGSIKILVAKDKPLWAAAVILCAFLYGMALGFENPGIRNPIGSPTVPPSGLEGGLTQTADPIDTNGNLLITGNVRGGKHFQGPVPYNAITGFSAGLGSSSLDSFLRYSSGQEDVDQYTSPYQPFYSPTATVATTRAGYHDVFMPTTSKIIQGEALPRVKPAFGGQRSDMFGGFETASGVPQQHPQTSPGSYLKQQLWTSRPLSPGLEQMESTILDEFDRGLQSEKAIKYPRSESLTTESDIDRLQKIEDYDLQPQQISEEAAELKQSLTEKDDFRQIEPGSTAGSESSESTKLFETKLSQYSQDESLIDNSRLPFTQQTYPTRWQQKEKDFPRQWQDSEMLDELADSIDDDTTISQQREKSDPYELLKKHLDDLMKQDKPYSTDALNKLQETTGNKESRARSTRGRQSRSAIDVPMDDEEYLINEFTERKESTRQWTTKDILESGIENDTETSLDLSARARAIMGPHKSIESFSEDRFKTYIEAGQSYLKQGKYYKAADAYTLASIYKPEQPLAYARKSHALFAAGEYISSALFLARALELSQNYATYKVNLINLMGQKDKFDKRVADVKECLKISDAVELHFLLSYIYFQMGRLEEAKEHIDTAYSQTPDSKAINAMKKAIYDALEPIRPVAGGSLKAEGLGDG